MIAVIGGGIVGSLIARELNKYEKDVYLFEAKNGIGMGVTKGNSGIVHGGYDDPRTLRAELCYMGNRLYDELSKELSIEVLRVGSHVVAFNSEEVSIINEIEENAQKNNVKEYKILDKKETLEMEPLLNKEVLKSFIVQLLV